MLHEALAKAQAEMQDPIKDKKANYGKYADLTAVRKATLPVLNANGLTITQTTHLEWGPDGSLQFLLRTTLTHVSGESVSSDYPLPRDVAKPQQIGSALTYGRRYCWSAICGLAADEDDDAETAQAAGAGRKTQTKKDNAVRDVMHDVGKDDGPPPTFDVFNQFGEVIDTAGDPATFLKKVTDLVETSGSYWPNAKDNVTWIGNYAKEQNDKDLAAQARAVFKFGRDAFANYKAAKDADPAQQGPH